MTVVSVRFFFLELMAQVDTHEDCGEVTCISVHEAMRLTRTRYLNSGPVRSLATPLLLHYEFHPIVLMVPWEALKLPTAFTRSQKFYVRS
jgi:hypothetical protein